MAQARGRTFRIATDDDRDEVLALYRHLSPNDPVLSAEQAEGPWKQLLASDMTHVVVAEVARRVVSTCVVVIVPNLTRGARSFAVIENVVTLPDYRKQGLAAGVLQLAMDIAWERGCYKVMLSTGRTDEETLRFYEGVGFKRGTKTFFEARRT